MTRARAAKRARRRLAKLMSAHQAGDLARAEAGYREVLAAVPDDPDALHLLGIVRQQRGALDEAESLIRAAIAGRDTVAAYHDNLGVVLEARGRLEEALASYRRAESLEPGVAERWHNLGVVLERLGALEEAGPALTRALSLGPEDPETRYTLAKVELARGRAEDAAANARRALAARAHEGRYLAVLGHAERLAGRPGEALDALLAARAAGFDDPGLRRALAALLRWSVPRAHDARLDSALADLVASGEATRQELARCAFAHLRLKHRLWPCAPERVPDLLARLAADRLWLDLLEGAVCVDPGVERFLTLLRARLLETRASGEGGPRLAVALAIQAFANEYLWPCAAEDERALDALAAAIGGVESGFPEELIALASLHAMYRPPADQPWAGRLRALDRDGLAPAAQMFLRRCVDDPLRERSLAATIEQATPIDDEISRAVRGQYEDNPYPRWSAIAPEPRSSYAERLESRFREFRAASAHREATRVLVAGCGTGQEALASALRHPRAEVLALDLSRASLAYARRMAEDLGIGNVHFVHGDLLAAAALGREFDVIESTGVLHHLDEPARGLEALLGVLAPGGVMRIGLYSRRAREAVSSARARIAARGLAADRAGIRAFRSEVLDAGAEGPFADLLDSEDFYSTSGCRDLLFHVCERQFDWLEIGSLLDRFGLALVGIELADGGIARRYRREHPHDPTLTDLAGWDRFEREHPHTFAALLVFWCQRAEAGTGAAPPAGLSPLPA